MTEKSRIGRDPFSKKRSSPVKNILQNKMYESVAPPKVESTSPSRNLVGRLQDMDIRMNVADFIKGLMVKNIST